MGMGRKREHRKDLPLRMRFKHGAYYFRSAGKEIHLGRDYLDAMSAYAKLQGSGTIGTFNGLVERWTTQELPKRSRTTQKNYLYCLRPLRTAFGTMMAEEIRRGHLREYLEARPRVAGNRELELLSVLLNYGMDLEICTKNVCIGFKGNAEPPRNRYVSDQDYRAARALASEPVRLAMDIAYQTGLRLGDILKLTLKDLEEDGIHVLTGKDKKRMVFQWTPDLRAVMDRAKARKVTGVAIVSTRDGQPYSAPGFKAIWQRFMKRLLEQKAISERFTFHDLRAKAASDAEHPTQLLAHSSAATTQRHYIRSPRKVTPLRPKWDSDA